METKSIPQSLQNTLVGLTPTQRNAGNVTNESVESATEMRQEQDKKTESSSSTVSLSSDSLKLAAASAAKNISKRPPIENTEDVQKTLSTLLNGFQNNPSQALGSQSAMPSRVVKELLG